MCTPSVTTTIFPDPLRAVIEYQPCWPGVPASTILLPLGGSMPTFGPTLAVNDRVQIVSYCQMGDQAGLNVFHYKVTGLATAGGNALSRLMEALETATYPASLRACMTSTAAYRGFTAQILAPVPSIAYGSQTGAGIGGIVSQGLPRQDCGIIQKRSAVPGRRKGGRFYVPFPAEENNTTDGIPDATYLGLINALATVLEGALTWGDAGSAVPVIYTRPDPTHIPPVLASDHLIATCRGLQKWATQRRRGSFGRTNSPPF